jgi:hypothetical protein
MELGSPVEFSQQPDTGPYYSGTSVHEFNSFLEAVRQPKCS